MEKKHSTKSRKVNYWQVPRPLWRCIKKHLPKETKREKAGRPRISNRAVMNGIWFVLWSGCQWKAVHREWFGVSSSVLHERFQTWREAGIWEKVMQGAVRYYARKRHVKWKWQSIDSKMVPAPLGREKTGKNPTDRGKRGSKIHILVDGAGAPLAIQITAANQHDMKSALALMESIVVKRPTQEQHLCADKGYDYPAVHQAVVDHDYIAHIKHRRLRNEPKAEECPIPGEASYPARRWVVERTLGWLAKRRSLKIRWAKNPENWLAFAQIAAADILCDWAIFG